MLHTMGMAKWMACHDGCLLLALGTVKEEGERRANTVRIRAHTFIMFACMGADQGGLTGKVAMHTCNNKGCMNPAHMLVGSTPKNMVEDYSSLQTDRQRLLADRDVAAG
jgi:hypothetical protein